MKYPECVLSAFSFPQTDGETLLFFPYASTPRACFHLRRALATRVRGYRFPVANLDNLPQTGYAQRQICYMLEASGTYPNS